MRLPIICATMLLAASPASASFGQLISGKVYLDNRFVEMTRDGKPLHLKNNVMKVEIESDFDDLKDGPFSVTTTIEYRGKQYSSYADCTWEETEDIKEEAECSISEDGGSYTVVTDWEDAPHGPPLDIKRMFLKFDQDGFRVAEGYTLGTNKETLTLPVEHLQVKTDDPEESEPQDETEENEG